MEPVVLAALISLIATETAGLIAALGLLFTRKPPTIDTQPTVFWEIRFREIADDIRENRDQLHEIKWLLVGRTKEFTAIENALKEQGKALGDVANALQDLIRRRLPR